MCTHTPNHSGYVCMNKQTAHTYTDLYVLFIIQVFEDFYLSGTAIVKVESVHGLLSLLNVYLCVHSTKSNVRCPLDTSLLILHTNVKMNTLFSILAHFLLSIPGTVRLTQTVNHVFVLNLAHSSYYHVYRADFFFVVSWCCCG